MVNAFDNAFLDKIKSVWPNTIYANTAITYNAVYSKSDNPTSELKLPLLNIYRPEGYSLPPNQTLAARLQGSVLDTYKDLDTGETITARFIVANLQYQIDIYAKTPEELDNITEDLIHMMSLNPTLVVVQKDTTGLLEYREVYDLDYVRGPVSSDEFNNDDRVYRYAIAYEIKNARLINFRKVGLVTSVETEVEVIED